MKIEPQDPLGEEADLLASRQHYAGDGCHQSALGEGDDAERQRAGDTLLGHEAEDDESVSHNEDRAVVDGKVMLLA
jgi:hypothetical protein